VNKISLPISCLLDKNVVREALRGLVHETLGRTLPPRQGTSLNVCGFRTKGTAMTTITPEQVLHFARQLSPTDQRWLVLHLQEHLAATLPEHATLDEAVGLYLVEACSLGRAAELAGVTRWDILDALQARGAMQHPGDLRSADDMDDLAERLEQRGML